MRVGCPFAACAASSSSSGFNAAWRADRGSVASLEVTFEVGTTPSLPDWIPAFAGMTEWVAGMTEWVAGMTDEGAGMTDEGAGMTDEGVVLADEGAGLAEST